MAIALNYKGMLSFDRDIFSVFFCVLAEPLVCISGYIAGFVPAVSRFSILFAGTNIHEVISFFQANAPFSGAGVRFSVSSGMVAKL